MAKLIIVLPGIDIGGAQRFCLNFCTYLNKINYDYKVIFLRKAKNSEFRDEFITKKIKFIEFNKKKAWFAFRNLYNELKKNGDCTVLSTVGNIDFICSLVSLFLPKVKLIIRKANVIFDNQKTLMTRFKIWFEGKRCTKFVSLTQEMQEDYIQYGIDPKKMIVINNMVDLNYIENKENEKLDTSFKKNKKKIIITSARFVPEKRYDVLLNAFYELRKIRNDVSLIILGNGPLFDTIKDSVPEEYKNDIIFYGFQNNPYYFMRQSDLFVLTSDFEGFPNVIIEAFSCGLPVIATDAKTGPKEIIKEGKNGYIVPRGDFQMLAKKIDDLLSSGELEKYKKCAKASVNQYSIEKISNEYINLL